MVPTITIQCLLALAAVGPAKHKDANPLVDAAQLQQAGFVKFWQARLPLVDGDTIEEGFVVDEAVYVTTDFGNLYALTADAGLLRWSANLTEPDYRIFPPTHVLPVDGAGPVVIPTTTEVFVFDRFSGNELERFAPEFATGSAAVAFNHHLLMGSSDGRFYSLVFNHPKLDKPIKRWEVMALGPVTASPVLYGGGQLLFASQSGRVFSCRASDKSFNWSYSTGGPIVADPVVDSTGAYVASTDRALYKLNHYTGMELWRVRFPRPLNEGPTVIAGTVYQYCDGQGLTALKADDGSEMWRHGSGRTLAAHSSVGDVVFAPGGRVDVLDHETGIVRASIDAPRVFKAIRNPLDDAVFLLGRDGRVLCIRLDSVPYLRRQQVTAARRRLNSPPPDESARIKRPRTPKKKKDPLENDPLRSRRDVKP